MERNKILKLTTFGIQRVEVAKFSYKIRENRTKENLSENQMRKLSVVAVTVSLNDIKFLIINFKIIHYCFLMT